MGYLSDEGIKREEHKLLYEFMPGQLSGHPPKWHRGRGVTEPPVDNVVCMVSKIFGVREMDEEKDSNRFNAIKLGTEPFLKEHIRRLGKVDKDIDIRYCTLKADIDITVELEIFPYVWESYFPEKEGNPIFNIRNPAPEIRGRRITQPNIVFCNPQSNRFPFIDQMDIPASNSLLTREIDLPSKQLIYDGQTEKVHAKGWNPGNSEDWRGKPRFAHDRSNFITDIVSDVYPPEMESASEEGLLRFWEINKLLTETESQEVKQAAHFANMFMKDNPESFSKDPILVSTLKNYLDNKINKGYSIDNVLDLTHKFYTGLNVVESEEVKIFLLQKAAIKQRDIGSAFKVFYCDKLEIANFSIGYYSGKYYDPREKEAERPILRSYPGSLKSAGVYDIKRADGSVQWTPITNNKGNLQWNVFLQTFKTEGLLFVADEKRVEEKIGTEPANIRKCMHTLAHSLIRNIPKYSGIDYGLIREYLFETKPAFFLYSSEPGDLRTRGLEFLFDYNIENLIEDVIDTLDCPFAVLEAEGENVHVEGCGNCTMLPVGCGIFNRDLDRLLALEFLGG